MDIESFVFSMVAFAMPVPLRGLRALLSRVLSGTQ